ncbi:LPD29 domain-containing protein [Nocardia africana]|uniref:Large polyvalent protein associated domain-containing protein n=1 Tax=Nocardia africana TaxID=134964 RepID=A0A379X4P8_9NOCA|nr:LPD29 domain-containing protein [Nocardia africana]MCC3318458.1 hypothetical protein [Nocardia africana]SUH71954.1 Uncharacterised protein [Nocardia africana]
MTVAPVRVLSAEEVAARIRQELDRRWPGVAFTVRSGRGQWRHWVMVTWTDGPTEPAVREAVGDYEALGSGHDDSGPVVYGIHAALCTREVSAAAYGLVAEGLERAYPIIVPRQSPHIDWDAAHAVRIDPPIDMRGPMFGPLDGLYASTEREPISAAHAIRTVADAVDLSDVEFDEPQPAHHASWHEMSTRALRAVTGVRIPHHTWIRFPARLHHSAHRGRA